MSLVLIGTHLCTFSLAIGFGRIRLFSNMSKPKTRLSSKLLQSKSQMPGSESSNGDSVPELGVFVRKKRVKKIVQVEEEEHEAESDDKKV
uniref:Uncharacterized protein n=1 Tax=Fagus sylvatica TaxID=28930 RepID=A0A2N9IQI3_FAGSY